MSDNYHEDIKEKNTLRLRALLADLPPFLDAFFRGVADTKSARTRLAYARDLTLFFTFLTESIPRFAGLGLKTFTMEHFRDINADDIERFLEHLNVYTTVVDGAERKRTNEASGKSRKLAAVRTMFAYYYKKQYIASNPAALVDFPALRHKAVVRLEVDEVARLLDEVESGGKLSGRQRVFHAFTKQRDLALITLLLGTGMRISECVGLNADHLDFNKNAVVVTRKGGDEQVLYFSGEVAGALRDYLDEREKIVPLEGHEAALFLSLQRRRLSVRAIEILVKKYAKLVTSMKKITPHKLRSTFGTSLYNETSDIYLVAEVLGHSDVNTTTKHYAHMSDERRRQAASAVKLRES